MNSLEKIYGRKVIRTTKEDYYKRIYISWVVCIAIGFTIGCAFMLCVNMVNGKSAPQSDVAVAETIEPIVWGDVVESAFVPLDVPMDEELQQYTYSLCHAYGVDFELVMALINQESSFQTDIISTTNDFGLMQINQINHKWLSEKLGITDFNDPHQNIHCGVYMLSDLLEKYEEPSKALMAYNMGETGAARLWEQGIYETTYSQNILNKMQEFKVGE